MRSNRTFPRRRFLSSGAKTRFFTSRACYNITSGSKRVMKLCVLRPGGVNHYNRLTGTDCTISSACEKRRVNRGLMDSYLMRTGLRSFGVLRFGTIMRGGIRTHRLCRELKFIRVKAMPGKFHVGSKACRGVYLCCGRIWLEPIVVKEIEKVRAEEWLGRWRGRLLWSGHEVCGSAEGAG